MDLIPENPMKSHLWSDSPHVVQLKITKSHDNPIESHKIIYKIIKSQFHEIP